MVNKQHAYKLNVAENVRWIQGTIRFETRELLKDRVPIDEKK